MPSEHILNSDWLLHMLQKASATPQGRILALFDILQDWLDAPLVNASSISLQGGPSAYPRLLDFITTQAEQLNAQVPQLLASQICLMAIAALQEKLQHTESTSLNHAKLAAQALITAQTKEERPAFSQKRYAASLAAVFVLSGSLIFYSMQTDNAVAPTVLTEAPKTPATQARTIANPEQTAALFAEIDRMRHGNCQLIEAIQLPDAYKQIYFDNIVSGQISTNPNEQRIVLDLLKMVRCNYTPMLMANSTG